MRFYQSEILHDEVSELVYHMNEQNKRMVLFVEESRKIRDTLVQNDIQSGKEAKKERRIALVALVVSIVSIFISMIWR